MDDSPEEDDGIYEDDDDDCQVAGPSYRSNEIKQRRYCPMLPRTDCEKECAVEIDKDIADWTTENMVADNVRAALTNAVITIRALKEKKEEI